jgi:MFS family permease
VVIANWFGERRGTALGLATAGMESGGMAMAFMTGHIISQYGWRAAYFALSIPALVLVLPLIAIVVRTRPAGAAKQKAGEPAQALPGYEVGEAIRTRVFWMLAGAVIHIVAYLTGIGYTMSFATTVFAILGLPYSLGSPRSASQPWACLPIVLAARTPSG